MVTPRKCRRVEYYVGPQEHVTREGLAALEAEGCWIISPKIDGMWSYLEVNGAGDRHVLNSRDATTDEISGEIADQFVHLNFPVYLDGAVFAGELEAASQWSTDQAKAHGGRRKIHLFDIYKIGGVDLRDRPTHERLALLKELWDNFFVNRVGLSESFELVEHHTDRFIERYDGWIAAGLEGAVVKHRDSIARSTNKAGKIKQWLKCKRVFTAEYVLTGTALTPGGQAEEPILTGTWGLYRNDKLVTVMKVNAPVELREELLVPANFGKLVCEFKGASRFASGALQHAAFLRVRTDKQPEQCTMDQFRFSGTGGLKLIK